MITKTIFDDAPFLTVFVPLMLVALLFVAEALCIAIHGLRAALRARRARIVAGYVRKGMGQWETI